MMENGMNFTKTKKLKKGYTTGSCAAAASKAAVYMLFAGQVINGVSIDTPAGIRLNLALHDVEITGSYAKCAVVKDGGDDPDVTSGLKVFAKAQECEEEGIFVEAGEGIGIATMRGLKVEVGKPAINPVPMQMIKSEVGKVLPQGKGVKIILSVPGGEEAAKKTYNSRLGIEGGISIIGTTGIVNPMSEEAWKEALFVEMNVMVSKNIKNIFFVFGNIGEELLEKHFGINEKYVIKISNFLGSMLEEAAEKHIESVVVAGHIGKLVKVAGGIFNTHSRIADARMEILAAYAALEGASRQTIENIYLSNTTEAAMQIIDAEGLQGIYRQIVKNVSERCQKYTYNKLKIGSVLFGAEGKLIAMDDNAEEIIYKLTKKDNFEDLPDKSSSLKNNAREDEDRKKIYIAGAGPGSNEYIIPFVNKLLLQCDVIIGGKRNLESFGLENCHNNYNNKEIIYLDANLEYVCEYIKQNAHSKTILILSSGDPCVFGIMEYFKKKLLYAGFSDRQYSIEVIPGISSLQYFCAKLLVSLNDVKIISMHGRKNEDIEDIVSNNVYTAIFTDSSNKPDKICSMLLQKGFAQQHISVYVGENLSYENEKIIHGTLCEISNMQFGNLTLMLLHNLKPSAQNKTCKNNWTFDTYGMPDDIFERGHAPMTKEEIRALSISKLRLKHNSIVYDIGAGTGSVSVECALICRNGRIYAIEKDEQAAELICKNALKFDAQNIDVIKGEAPEVLHNLPLPQRVFIGGTDGNLEQIIKNIGDKLGQTNEKDSYIRIVVNAVTIETAYEAITCFENCGFKNIEIINVSISRGIKAGIKHMMKAGNPVYIISAEKGDVKNEG